MGFLLFQLNPAVVPFVPTNCLGKRDSGLQWMRGLGSEFAERSDRDDLSSWYGEHLLQSGDMFWNKDNTRQLDTRVCVGTISQGSDSTSDFVGSKGTICDTGWSGSHQNAGQMVRIFVTYLAW